MELASKTFENQMFHDILCQGQDLRDKEFSDCTFKKCNFSESDFSNSTFVDCSFADCDLSNIKVKNCAFRNVAFENCKLLGITFDHINAFLLSWRFSKCLISFCVFSGLDMRHSQFIDCVIRETEFSDVDLQETDFSNSDLEASRFQNTDLRKAIFKDAKNYYIDPTLNKLKGAHFAYPEVLSLLVGFGIKIDA